MTTLADRQLADWLDAVRKLGRAPDEWIGAHADSKPPERVRDRIRRTWGVCHISGIEIRAGMPFELEHIIPLSMGGFNRESNLRPAISIEHRKKSRREAKDRAKADQARRASFGTKVATKQPIKSAGFPPKPARAEKLPLPARTRDIYGRAV